MWVDAFAPTDKKTTWMTLIIIAAPKGMLAGYGLSALVISNSDSWWYSFYIVMAFMVPLMVVLAFVDKRLIDIKEHLLFQHEQSEQQQEHDE